MTLSPDASRRGVCAPRFEPGCCSAWGRGSSRPASEYIGGSFCFVQHEITKKISVRHSVQFRRIIPRIPPFPYGQMGLQDLSDKYSDKKNCYSKPSSRSSAANSAGISSPPGTGFRSGGADSAGKYRQPWMARCGRGSVSTLSGSRISRQ